MQVNRNAVRGMAVFTVIVLVTLMGEAEAAATVHLPIRRAVSDSSSQNDMEGKKICMGNTQCKWEVYIPSSRRIVQVMNNTCECPSDKLCIMTEDDLSVSAYVHRCRSPQIS